MTLYELTKSYNMHDSLITSISQRENDVVICIDYAFWMQPGFVEGNPETGPLEIRFKNVISFICPENINLDEISILSTATKSETFVFSCLNDVTDEYLEITIEAASVEVKE